MHKAHAARISNLLPPAVLDGGIRLLVQQLHKQLLLRLQGLPLRVHQHVPHLLLLRRAAVQRQMVLLQRALRHGGRPHIGRGQVLQNGELAAPLVDMDAAAVVEKNENVMTDLSGLLEGKIDFPKLLEQQRGYFDTLKTWISYCSQYEKFMFGTDWPLANYGDYIGVVKWLIPEKEWEKVFYENAKRIYGF